MPLRTEFLLCSVRAVARPRARLLRAIEPREVPARRGRDARQRRRPARAGRDWSPQRSVLRGRRRGARRHAADGSGTDPA